jgi:hypothetical protein
MSESDIADLRNANEQHDLGMILEHDEKPIEQFDEQQVVELFEMTSQLPDLVKEGSIPETVKKLPIYRNYQKWYDLLKVGFIKVNDIPDYDPEANARLGELINDCETIHY